MNNPRRIQRHLVKALAAGALLAAAALPLAIATAASAATPGITSVTFTPSGAGNTIGQGSSGTVTVTGTGFAGNGGAFALTGTGLTFTGEVETASTTSVTANYAVGASAAAGEETLSFTDAANTTALTLADAYDVTLAPTLLGGDVSPAFIGVSQSAASVTLSGVNYETGAVVSFVSAVDGTSLKVGASTLDANGDLTVSVTPVNAVSGGAATVGNYTVKVTNPDGGSVSLTAGFAVDLMTVSEISPSAVANAAGSTTLTITGSGFEYGAVVTTTTVGCSTLTFGASTFGSPTSLTVTATLSGAQGTASACNIKVTNPPATNPPAGIPAGNAATFTLTGGLGVGVAATVAPVVTASSSTAATAIVPGSAGSTVTLTGLGFGIYPTIAFTDAAGTDPATGITANDCIESGAGTTLTCVVAVGSGAVAGTDSVSVRGSTPFADGLYVAGPSITSSAPSALDVGAPVGTTLVLTGTGFTNTMTIGAHAYYGALTGILEYVSATTANFVVTSSPTTGDVTTPTQTDSISLSQVVSSGVSVLSAPFDITVDAQPVVTSAVTYSTVGTTGVGVGATAQPIVINGANFAAGATVTAFTNTAAVADANVTVKVTAVNAAGTQITGTVAVAAGDTNTAVGYTVTNVDGGKAVVSAYQFPIVIDAGPTITSVTPATGAAAATTSFAIAGTGFTAGSVVTLSPANGTCGAATVTASTTLAVTCTLGTPGVTPTSLVVTNADGGSVTSSPVLAVGTVAKPFHVSGVHGAAVAGKWVTVSITGTGFYGQPKITGGAAGTKFAVLKDNGSALTVKIYTKAGVSGEHTLTVHLANGKAGKAGYNTKA